MSASMLESICAARGWRFHADRHEIEVGLEDGRKQRVRVEAMVIDGDPYLRLISTIGPSEALDRQRSQAALRLNAELRHGAFAILADELAVVDRVVVGDGSEGTLAAALAYLAKTADRYEQVVFGTDAR